MKTLVILVACLSVVLGADSDSVDESHVLVLTEENFQATIEENEFVLAEFYAPWCGHCKALIPEYAQAAATLAEQDSPIKLGKIDATVESKLAQSYEVRGYPTIKFFKNGVPKDYNGGRKADDIVSWVTRNSGPSTKTMESLDQVKELVASEEVMIMGYFESTDSTEAGAYSAAADSLSESLTFGITTDKDIITGMEADVNTVVVYKKFDEGKAVFSGDWTAEDISVFVQAEELPLLVTFSDQVAPKIFGGDIKTHFLVFFPQSDLESYTTDLTTVAKEMKGKILFVHINSDSEDSSRIMEFFTITKEDIPAARLISMGDDMKKFVPEFKGFAPDNVRAFCEDFLTGTLRAHLNTEDIPEDWNEESVVVLVGKNFKEVALDQSKHVFVEFYAPWCGHCKQLAPIWEELGDHFKDDDDVIIAKMDSTKNEIEEVQIQGFPTLKFFPKGSDKVIDYDGARTLDELVEYVEGQVRGDTAPEEGEDEPEEEEEESEEPPRDEL